MNPDGTPSRRGEAVDGASAGKRIITLPNVICFLRLAVSPALIVLAVTGYSRAFLILYAALALSDWIDGKLAIWLNQRSSFGARLDTVADVTLYTCLLLGSLVLAGEVISQESLWIGIAVGSYAITVVAGWWKFRRLPSFHTRGAKTAWLLILISAWCVFAYQITWTLRIALLTVALVNIETLLITRILPEWRTDVPSIWHALRIRQQHDADSKPAAGVGGNS